MIRTGIGGWTFAAWRGAFYPPGLRQADELRYAAAHLGTIEINATYYRLHKPRSFAAWRDAAPAGFKFAVKASRFCTNRKVLAGAGEGIGRFFGQGIDELGDKLGPILWQFAPTRRFEPQDFAAFLDLLPARLGDLDLRHALEVRHESFACPEFVALARQRNMAIVCTDHPEHKQIADLTADFSYARLMRAEENVATGYRDAALDQWAGFARAWQAGEAPDGLAYAAPPASVADGAAGRDVFVYAINGAKIRAPAAAIALAQRVKA